MRDEEDEEGEYEDTANENGKRERSRSRSRSRSSDGTASDEDASLTENDTDDEETQFQQHPPRKTSVRPRSSTVPFPSAPLDLIFLAFPPYLLLSSLISNINVGVSPPLFLVYPPRHPPIQPRQNPSSAPATPPLNLASQLIKPREQHKANPSPP